MSTVCLNMIVKDEAHVIRRCLEAARPLIDTWVIVDTGSSDGTQSIIKETLSDIPGCLYQRPWVNFGHNRTEAIELASGAADYLLFVDADDTLLVPDGFQLPELSADAYELEILHGSITYRRTCVVRNDAGWRFEGVLHEYPTCGRPANVQHLEHLAIRFGGDGRRSQQDLEAKYAEDARVLQNALVEEPDNARYAFYLAQSLRDSNQAEAALAAYEARATMGGYDQEIYWSLLQAGRLARGLRRPDGEVIDRLLHAFDFRPSRVEALGDLAILCRELGGRWSSGLMFAEQGLEIPASSDNLFVEPSWHDWRLLDEKAIALYWLGRYDESLAACDVLLDGGMLPEEQRERIRANRGFAAEKLGR